MSHKEVYNMFVKMFPMYKDDIQDWFLNGKNCIRVRLKTGEEYVFTYRSEKMWRLETAKNFIEVM